MIWVECYPDKELVRVLGFKGFHAKRGGKGGVISKVERGGVGIVDLDYEGTIPRNCQEVDSLSRRHFGIVVMRCGRGWLVILDRNLETFLLATAREASVDVESYGLPNDPRELHHVISLRRPPDGFIKLLRDLRISSSRFEYLAGLLKRLVDLAAETP